MPSSLVVAQNIRRRPMSEWLQWLATHGVLRAVAAIGVRQGDLLATLMHGTHYEHLFDELAQLGPLVKGRLSYVTVDHGVSHALLRSDDFQVLVGPSWLPRDGVHPLRDPSLLSVEGIDHTRYRKAVAELLSPRVVAELRAGVERTAAGLLAHLSGTVDIVESYCSRLPVAVIGDILGVPERERPTFGFVGPSLDLGLPWKTYRSGQRAVKEFTSWIAAQQARTPSDNWMSQLIEAAQSSSVTQLTDAELRGGIAALTLAGFESASNLVASGIRMLLDAQRPKSWPNAVDEILRLEPPVQFTARRAIRDTEVAAVRIKRGELVMVYVAAANRDPAVFADPHRFDAERPNAGRHLSFSGGRHLCPGNGLARLYGEVGLRAFFARFPGARLAGPGARKSMTLLRGWSALPVVLV